MFFWHSVTGGFKLFARPDKGTDSPEIPGNDGRPKYNYVAFNTIYSERDDAAKVSEADYNVLEVSFPLARALAGGIGGRCPLHEDHGVLYGENAFISLPPSEDC